MFRDLKGESCYETPTVTPFVDGRLFVRGAYGLYCYDLRARSRSS